MLLRIPHLLKYLKIHPKSRKAALKPLPNSVSNPKCVPNASRTLFFRFLAIFPGPGASENRAKIFKIRKKTLKSWCWKIFIFWTQFFIEFSWFRPLKPKSMIFHYFFDNADLMKNIDFPHEKPWFSRFRASKNPTKIDVKSHSEKHRKKISEKSISAWILASQNILKSLQIRFGAHLESDVGRSLFRDAMEMARTSSQSNGNHGL